MPRTLPLSKDEGSLYEMIKAVEVIPVINLKELAKDKGIAFSQEMIDRLLELKMIVYDPTKMKVCI
jgi:hypothetical protein